MKKLFIVIILCSVISRGLSQSNNPKTGLNIGNEAPEIKLPNPMGDTTALSSLRGSIVLIDFWASWCVPCVKEQPKLRRLYQKYKKSRFEYTKGFEVYSVSLDSKRAEWMKIIKKLKLNWTHVSDLKFWNSGAARLYGIGELPYNILVDSNGVIVARNLHGAGLNKEIVYLLKR